ncbi:MAG TPA: HTH-type transcriptional repressor FabR [Acidimicrobiales bacterium]|nr:HTH-type transcriptional repressor FabR [Acidimicrobiales bacterium]
MSSSSTPRARPDDKARRASKSSRSSGARSRPTSDSIANGAESGRPSRDRRADENNRAERKSRTRRALLDAALDRLDSDSFGSMSLREVTKQAGIVPTAFYRHFRDMDELGLALVEESIGALHDLLVAARAGVTDRTHAIHPSLEILRGYVRDRPTHFRFLVRERAGGSATLRHAIGREIKLFATELAVDLARERATWPTSDIQRLADLIVTMIVATIEALVDATDDTAESQVIAAAADQMTLVLLGATVWQPERRHRP